RPIAVHCDAVTKSYGSGQSIVRALRGIDLDVYQNELMMLVGPSGCGKTTLISIIAGVLDRDGGDCSVFGEDFSALSSGQRVRFRGRTIGFVFQSFNLIPTLTIAENIAVPLLLQGVKRREAMDRAREVLGKVGLAERWRESSSKLSGGQQQRVAICRAIVHGPRLIVCDEPTSALDHATGEKVMNLMREAAVGNGKSLIVVTHDSRIYSYADRIAMMDDGQVIKLVNDPRSL
ncbi:MAG: ABC transporter ATP-binding protein, partial [Planctomycetota bacterium]